MSGVLKSYEPATGALIWNGKIGDPIAETAVARKAWPQWAVLSMGSRSEIIYRFANRVRSASEKLAGMIARETGKPLWEARLEVEQTAARVEISMKAYSDRTSQRRVEGAHQARNALRHKPHGVLAILGPFCSPLLIPVTHIIPALLAGNAIVFKPSEHTPAIGEELVKMLQECGVPPTIIRFVAGGPDVGSALIQQADIDGVLFTGSSRTGMILNRHFAAQPNKLVALEMGGNNPIIVWDTLDISGAATLVVQSAFASAGQNCMAASRLIVRDVLYERLIQEINLLTGRLIVGEPLDNPAPFMGPVIDNNTAEGLLESFVVLMSSGGKVIRHMTRPVKDRPFITPGIIDVTNLSQRPDIELFGPLLQVVSVSTFEEAVAEANNSRYGLVASLIGGTADQYDTFWLNVKAGIINWNRPTTAVMASAPIGGVGLSGNHRPTSYYAADYCAYPVASTEAEQIRASIGVGLKMHDDEAVGITAAPRVALKV